MTCTSTIKFRNVDRSEALEAKINEKIAHLATACPNLLTCQVTIDMPSRNHQHGNLYELCIDMTVPGAEVVISKVTGQDIYVVVQEGFDAARRKLREHEDTRRSHRKQVDVVVEDAEV